MSEMELTIEINSISYEVYVGRDVVTLASSNLEVDQEISSISERGGKWKALADSIRQFVSSELSLSQEQKGGRG